MSGYRLEIQGLRAAAVLLVLLYHGGFPGFAGGYIGVDIFFVISGFIIATVMLAKYPSGQINIIEFYSSRCKRLLPSLCVILLLVFALAWLLFSPSEFKSFSKSLFAIAFFSTNYLFSLNRDYFDPSSELEPLLHTWSLSLEVQFYLVLPLFFYKLISGKNKILLGFALFSSLFFFLINLSYFETLYYSFEFRLWQFLSGVLSAFFLERVRFFYGKVTQEVLSLLACCIILFSVFAIEKGLSSISVVVGTILFLCFCTRDTLVARVFSIRFADVIGRASYSIYLIHFPLLVFMRVYGYDTFEWFYTSLWLGASIGLGVVLCLFIEEPIRFRWLSNFRAPAVVSLSFIFVVVCGLIGWLGYSSNGFPNRSKEISRLVPNYGLSPICNGAVSSLDCSVGTDVKIAVWGDSYAMHMVKALQMVSPDKGLIQNTLSGCPPFLAYVGPGSNPLKSCAQFNQAVRESLVKDYPGLEMIFLATRFDFSRPDAEPLLLSTINSMPGVQFVVVSPTLEFPRMEKCIAEFIRESRAEADCTFRIEEAVNLESFEAFKKLMARYSLPFIDLTGFTCPEGACSLGNAEALVYRDQGHLAVESAEALSRYMIVKYPFFR